MFNVTARKTKFSPPCGDCTKIVNAIEKAMTLSSPYGDGISILDYMGVPIKFSPPYGDCTFEER